MYKETVGLEVHVELNTNKKAFSNSLNNFHATTNANINEIDMAYPGVLPILNQDVVLMALKVCLALNCKINKKMHFDRKNYFYKDLPKGYQITQNKTPIGYDGYINIDVAGVTKRIGIERIHIEEDTAKSINKDNYTLLNFNRAGVPLIEIVTKPDIKNGDEAKIYLTDLRAILLHLGVSDVKIEEGSMRVDCNVSISKTDELGTRCEVKNIGSISDVSDCIDVEKVRQAKILDSGDIISYETRRYDAASKTTKLLRKKEEGNDYRYHEEPDIPYITLDDYIIEKTRNELPKLPNELMMEFLQLGLSEVVCKTIIGNIEVLHIYEDVYTKVNPVLAANILTSIVVTYMNANDIKISDTKFSTDKFIQVLQLVENNTIINNMAKDIINKSFNEDINVLEYIKANNDVVSDADALSNIIDEIISSIENISEQVKENETKCNKMIMGLVMKKTSGKANPKIAASIVVDKLKNI